MAEHCFRSSLSIEEIGENFRDFDLLLDSWSRWKRFWTTHTAKILPASSCMSGRCRARSRQGRAAPIQHP